MPASDLEQEKARHKQELGVQRQIAFASGLFQGDITIRTLLESLAEGVVIIDSRGTILLVNTLAEQMFGYPNKDLIGKPLAVLIPERFRKIHEKQMAHFFAEPMIRPMVQFLDLAGRRQDGSEFPVEINLSFIETINGILALAFVTDVTLRKQVELHLRESEKLFRMQVECVQDYAIFMLDTEGNILNWNAGAERLKGYGEKEIIGKHFSCFYPEEERNAGKPEEELKKAAAEGRFEDEGWRVRKDGGRFWADVIITALRDENGNLRGFSKVTRDITGRKKVEDEIQDAREYAENIVETVREPLMVLNSDLKILTANHSFYDTFKVTPEETIGNFIYDLGNRQWDIPKLRVLFEEILPNDTVFNGYEVEHDFLDIGRKIILLNARQIFRENIGSHIILLAMEDITERKRVEEEREQLLVQLDAVLSSINEGVVISDLEGNILTMNPSALAIHDYESADQIRRQLHQYQDTFELSDLDGRPVAFEQWPLSRVLRGEQFTDYEVRLRRKDTGKSLICSYSGTPVQTKSGDTILSVITVRDITERKLAEEEIERLNTDLAARAADLEDANRELETFNYTVAHDLRKPLTAINGYCQLIRELCGDNLTEACKDYLREAYDGTWRMNRLIDALLSFSRVGHVEPRREIVDLSAIAHEVAAVLQLSEPERRVTFIIADVVSADGDAALLRVVLDNLLGNAWKYTGMREEAAIEFGVTEVKGDPAYFVRDNGAGFDKEDAAKLFIPFQRLHGSEQFKGFGIGLATVERIIRRHGGRVWAEGAPGNGATFYFTL
jgi:PAS domain S-box-containing protein